MFFRALRTMQKYLEKNPRKLEDLLVGPKPPDEFEGDGCSFSPDLWFRAACRIHDWEYFLLRDMEPRTELWKTKRKEADLHLKKNIQILSTYEIKDGKVVEVAHWSFHRRWGYKLCKLYYWGVRKFSGWAANGQIVRNE